jgi:hypothetical protein
MNKYRYFLWLTIVVILMMIAACGPRETELPFEMIEQADWGNAGSAYEAKEPALVVVAQPVEADRLDDWITLHAQTYLQNLDYETYFAIVVFQGWKPTSGYNVQIDRIARRGNIINVYVQFREPKPEEAKASEATSPYHLVRVRKVGAWDQDITFNLIVDEVVVTSLSHYVR